MTPPVPPLLLEQQRVHHSGLAVEEAWEIALAWSESVGNKVFLVKTGNRYDAAGLESKYAWINFDVRIERRSEVSAARAAALTWFALSCCPGYGGHEHPVFWKCVFSELTQVITGHSFHENGQSITDAVPFFEGVDFPRFYLNVYTYHENVRLFCGVAGETLAPEDDSKLQQIMAQLLPWIDDERTLRRPDVRLQELRDTHLGATVAESVYTEFTRLLADVSAASALPWPSPTFSVKEIHFREALVMSDADFVDKFLRLLREHDVVLTEFCCVEQPYNSSEEDTSTSELPVSRDTLATVVRHVLGLPGVAVRGSVASVSQGSGTVSTGPAFLSAMPFTKTTHTLAANIVDAQSLAWLGYALFHPDTPSSAWTSLELSHEGFSDESGQVLRAMARGNNLTAVLNGHEPTSDWYYRATLAQGATVLDVRGSDAATAVVLATSDGSTTVDACGVFSADPREWDEWVQVVVPAYGLGWVLSSSVARVEQRRPSPSSLTRLRRDDSHYNKSESPTGVAAVLRLLGHRLVYLDLRSYVTPAIADLRHALAACTQLQSLALVDDGALWNGELLPPFLRELVLTLPQTAVHKNQLASVRLPRSLTQLRIVTVVWARSYKYNRAAVKHLLTHGGYAFHWRSGLKESHHPTLYTTTRADTAKRISELGLPPPQEADKQLQVATAIAFLSVLERHERWRALDVELAKAIVAFATEPSSRRVVIEPEAFELPEDRRHRIVMI